MAISQSNISELSVLYHSDSRKYRRSLLRLLKFGAVIALAGVAAAVGIGRYALDWLYGSEYAVYHFDLVIVAVGNVPRFMSIILELGLSSAGRFRSQALAASLGAFAAGVTTFWLLPDLDIRGAITCFVVASVITTLVQVALLRGLWTSMQARRPESGPTG